MSWPVVKLSDVATINPRPPRDVDESQEVTFVAMASASEDGYLLASEARILSETKKGFTYFDKNDVLLAKITPCFENGKCLRPGQIPTEIGFGSTEFHVIRPDTERLDGLYLFYLVWNEQFRFLGEKSMSGAAGQKRIGSDFLKGFEIPLPPLPEQKRIAAILDKADTIRRKRQQAIQLADDFLRAVFLDMFGDPVTNPKGWEVKPLGDVLKLSSGNGLSAKEMDSSGSYPVYGGNGVNGHHSEYMFKEPQLVIGRVGAYCGVVHITQPYSWVTDNALYVKDFVRDVNIHYLAQLLDISNLNQYAGKAAQPLVSGNRIYPLEMIFPPLQEQLKFEDIKVKYLESAKGFDFALLEAEAMFSSLSQKSFRGEL
ncbi:restriction endonuclease subunit S [Pseudomonas sp. PvP088]|uniref:restriction endonuclease subunit S n=1 Tax=Pseudomonas TaxID=286 RepID=UPI001D86BF14|nr:restriction endonuclease S subunit [Pseudomonas sp. PvP089]MBP2088469.1 restriction endonuclease S subunit [Pseudomonas sp. PvP088]MBP2225211.1 restriction endonuclease S subunit [Pseudomonas putida]